MTKKRQHGGFRSNKRDGDSKRLRAERAEAWKNTRGDDPNNRNNWSYTTTTDLQNDRFDAYYRAQGFLDPAEWESFVGALREPLPACFHMNPDYPFTDDLRRELHEKYTLGQSLIVDDKAIQPVEQLKWYPHDCGFKIGTDRKTIRKNAALNELHHWLVQHTANGNITRQEAVSMVPPLALDVQPHHRCLDMCAAPGSKTSQLLEIVNRSLGSPQDQQGLVVANDVDTERAYMLVHQCRRINSPLLLITTHKGQHFPSIEDVTGGEHRGFFDRVLCDVPCSGDGTLRKNPSIWTKWSTLSAMNLHPLQLQIAQRGVNLLKAGGMMVYSTCSMSPCEDEAVVAELLRRSNGSLELVDARQFIPLFKCRPGLSSWHVLDDQPINKKRQQERAKAKELARKSRNAALAAAAAAEAAAADQSEATTDAPDIKAESASNQPQATELAEPAEVETALEIPEELDLSNAPEAVHDSLRMGFDYFPNFEAVLDRKDDLILKRIRRSMFSPSAEEAQWMHLERCMRCVPHDEDTGGFFVAALRKVDNHRIFHRTLAADGAAESKVDDNANTAEDEEVDEQAALEACATTDEAADAGDTVIDVAETATANVSSDANNNNSSSRNNNHDDDDQPDGKGQRALVDYVALDDSTFESIRTFYGMPEELRESLFIREDRLNRAHKKFSKHQGGTHQAAGSVASKNIFFIPKSVRDVLQGDKSLTLQIVYAGVKVLEKKVQKDGVSLEYRPLQEGIHLLAPHITTRKVYVNIQDFCNILGGGLVSFSTLSPETLLTMSAKPTGALICIYKYDPKDVLQQSGSSTNDDHNNTDANHEFHAICWKGASRTVNVNCSKVEIEALKHQLTALKVFRPKIFAPKPVLTAVVPTTTAAIPTSNIEQAVAEGAAVDVETGAAPEVIDSARGPEGEGESPAMEIAE